MTDHRKSIREISPSIADLLARLRAKIRISVLLEGICWSVVWVITLFWVSFACDYLPVTFGYDELSRTARVIFLAITGVTVGWILFRLVFRRVFARLRDSSLALLIERRHPEFADSLVTTVNQTDPFLNTEHDPTADPDMLERTRLDAERRLEQVDTSLIVNNGPARQAMIAAGFLLASLVGFAIVSWPTFQLANQRLYGLSNAQFPRQCKIELVGLVVKRENTIPGIVELEQTVVAVNGTLKIARGSSVSMLVRAEQGDQDVNRRERKSLPETCWLNFYRSSEGTRGSQPFKRIGAPKNGFQTYVLDGEPLDNLISKLEFTITGGDDRIGPFTLEVVDEPAVRTTDLKCKFPDYIVDQESGRFLDRTERWTGEARLPEGTQVDLIARSKSDLKKVYIDDGRQDENGKPILRAVEVQGNEFAVPLPPLMQTTSVKFYLCDQDGIVSTTPHEVTLEPIADQSPTVTTQLLGIGTAVTPDVRLPIATQIDDDHGVDQAWIELEINANSLRENLAVKRGTVDVDTAIDFRKRRAEQGDAFRLIDDGQHQLTLVVAAKDQYSLGDGPNLGTGDRYDLDIVSPDELLRMIEQLEVGQRRRLEQVNRELREARKYLQRTVAKSELEDQLVEPGDRPEPSASLEDPDAEPAEDQSVAATEDEAEQRERELRRLFAQRSLLQTDKSKQEIIGSRMAFEDLRLQIINNRIVGTNREQRFEEQVIGPLDRLANTTLQRLRDSTKLLEGTLQSIESSEVALGENGRILIMNPEGRNLQPATPDQRRELERMAMESTALCLDQVDTAIRELNDVLNSLLKFETQNELLDIVRQMIKEQEQLLERTRKQRQKQAFEGLLK